MNPEKHEQNPAEFSKDNSPLEQDIAKLRHVSELLDQNFTLRLDEEVPEGFVKLDSYGKSSFSYSNLRNRILQETGYNVTFTKPDEEDEDKSNCSTYASSADFFKVTAIWIILHAGSIKNFDEEREKSSAEEREKATIEIIAPLLEELPDDQKKQLEKNNDSFLYLYDVMLTESLPSDGSQHLLNELRGTVVNDYENKLYKDPSEVVAEVVELSDAERDMLRRAITLILFRTSGIFGEIDEDMRDNYSTDYNLIRQAGINPLTFEEIAGMMQAIISKILEVLPELGPSSRDGHKTE